MANQPHIVMMPFPAQGHLIPFVALAKLIEQRRPQYTITVVSTPLNIENLKPSIPLNSNIHLKSLPFTSTHHNLPPNSESTDTLPHHHIIHLMEATESLQPHFDRLIADITLADGRPPLAIVSDVFFGWTVPIAKSHGIFHAVFTTSGAYGTAAYVSLWLNLPHTQHDSPEFNLPGFPETFRLQRSQLSHYMRASNGQDPWCLFLRRHILLSMQSNAMLCNTVQELEPLGLSLLKHNFGLHVSSIGPLSPLSSSYHVSRTGKKKLGIEREACEYWLDSHPPMSVLYVSFGSQNTISAPQMMELARGLEASRAPFIWVIRPPIGFDMNDSFRDEWLPQGFMVRMRETKQGMVVEQWAPQLEILSHESTGAFLSHCGWNSVLESLSHGVPIIGWPLGSDQFCNSKILEEELGVGVEVARGVEGDIEHGEVERVIRLVMGGGHGKEMRERATKFERVIRDAMREEGGERGSSLRALDEFIETALSWTEQDYPNGI